MTRRANVWGRTRRLEAVTTVRDVQTEAARFAAVLGIGPDDLLAEAEALALRCRAVGAVTLPAMAAVAAGEAGLDPDEVLAEAAVLVRAAGTGRNGRTA